MTLQEFHRAAERGMGRAALCLIERDPEPYIPDLLDVCTKGRDQLDRIDYLFSLIAFAGAEARAEDELLAKLPSIECNSQIQQVWGLLNRFAMIGRPRSRAAIMAYALRTENEDGASLVAEWGVEGLRWLLVNRPSLFEGDDVARQLIDAAEEVSGTEVVAAILPREVRAARDAYLAKGSTWESVHVEGLNWEDFLTQLREKGNSDEWRFAHAYAKIASPEDQRKAAEWVLSDEGRPWPWLAGAMFGQRPWPLDPALIFDRLDVRRPNWISILANLEAPRIRTLAFENLECETPNWKYIPLLAKNAMESDLGRLMRIMPEVRDLTDYETHDLFVGLAEMAKRAKPGLLPLYEWGIENSFCSVCRADILKGLARNRLFPDRYRKEVAYDVEPELHPYAEDRLCPRLSASRFRRALQRGLGRAVLAAEQGPAILYAPEVQGVTLYYAPMQPCEFEPRAKYLVHLAGLVGREEEILDALLQILEVPSEDEYLRDWRVAVLQEYARRGHTRAQAALPPPEPEDTEPPKPKKMMITRAAELARRFEAEPNPAIRRRAVRAFVRTASEPEFRLWAERLLAEEDLEKVEAMGKAFLRRPWPLDPERVIERVEDPERDSCVWRRMLKRMENPEIRPFALAKLAEREPDSDAIGYLRHVFQPGDETSIAAALARIDASDEQAAYYFSWELTEIARLHSPQPFLPFLEWVVENSSSSAFRTSSMEMLLKFDALSAYHRHEAAYDAEPETRALVPSPD